jgi:hypothetical protein
MGVPAALGNTQPEIRGLAVPILWRFGTDTAGADRRMGRRPAPVLGGLTAPLYRRLSRWRGISRE